MVPIPSGSLLSPWARAAAIACALSSRFWSHVRMIYMQVDTHDGADFLPFWRVIPSRLTALLHCPLGATSRQPEAERQAAFEIDWSLNA